MSKMFGIGKRNVATEGENDRDVLVVEEEVAETEGIKEAATRSEDEPVEVAFLSKLDREYVQMLYKLDRDEALKMLDNAYDMMRKGPEELMTKAEQDEYDGMLSEGRIEDAAEALSKAYEEAKKGEDALLTPVDKAYMDILQSWKAE